MVGGGNQEFALFRRGRQRLLGLKVRHVCRHLPAHVFDTPDRRVQVENRGQPLDGPRVIGVEAALLQPTLQQVGKVAFGETKLGVERRCLDFLLFARAVHGPVNGQFTENRDVAARVQVLQPFPRAGRRVERRSDVASALVDDK